MSNPIIWKYGHLSPTKALGRLHISIEPLLDYFSSLDKPLISLGIDMQVTLAKW